MPVTVSMTVNGKAVSADVEPRTLLVQYLREHLGLTGTHVGCDTSQCGACVVHVNGKSFKSCTMLAVQAEGANVTTIEGLAKNGELVQNNPEPTEHDVREWLEGNICRCTGYHNIVKSIRAGAQAMK
jgi:carbon-monoxide dehydrogenase small subunit